MKNQSQKWTLSNMLTDLDPKYKSSELAKSASSIIKKCAHRGFCNGTCPTFIELSDQHSGPRGRIYLIRAFLEGKRLSLKERNLLDLCITCRSCQTTCPANIEFGHLITIARTLIGKEYPRPLQEKIVRWLLQKVLPYKNRFALALTTARLLNPLLPRSMSEKIPSKEKSLTKRNSKKKRFVLLLEGCAQPSITPNTNIAAINVLNRLGISVKKAQKVGCCGAIHLSLGHLEKAKQLMKNNIDAWLQEIEKWQGINNGAEAILSLSSSCELMLTEYGKYLADDLEYSKKARKISSLVKNIGEILLEEDLANFVVSKNEHKVALHSPCSLRNGLEKHQIPEELLTKLGVTIVKTEDNHICCGAGGTYSILQTTMSQKLLKNKITALNFNSPTKILTSNASCQSHIASKSNLPVTHWIEHIERMLSENSIF
ncbi:glycolate oxidase subunit GlcF [Vibrio sp. MA40-2]|uniref:glycolate oxidase subunit GlcF n=1 Tax=Vibrio sp. MA40-2 TaxID=3391828 RepID=UPI0039A434B2